MKIQVISSLFFALHILTFKAEVGAESHLSKIRQVYSLHGDSKPANANHSTVLEPRISKRSQNGHPWTTEDEKLLVELREQQSSWKEIMEHFPGRSFYALKKRYYLLTRDPNGAKNKGYKKWTSEEKELLVKLVETGVGWDDIAGHFPGRTKKQVSGRYYDLKGDRQVPDVYRGLWTDEEKKLLIELGGTGMPWEEIATHFSNRSLRVLERQFKSLTAPRPKRYTLEEDNTIIEAIESGSTIAKISQLLGRSESGIRSRIRTLEQSGRVGIASQKVKGRHYTVADYSLMDELLNKDMSWGEIANNYFPGRSGKSMRESFRRYQEKQQRGKQKD